MGERVESGDLAPRKIPPTFFVCRQVPLDASGAACRAWPIQRGGERGTPAADLSEAVVADWGRRSGGTDLRH